MTHYFDIETDLEGRVNPDPMKDKIMTIQYQAFWDDTGKPKEPLTILKSWESSEKEILVEFLELTGWIEEPRNKWNFVPAGVNLSYDFLVLVNRSKELLGLEIPLDFIMKDIPKFDLQTVLVIANSGKFKGSGLDNFSKKAGSGKFATKYIQENNWKSLLKYIKQESEAFLDLYRILAQNIPNIVRKLQEKSKDL